MDLIVVEQYGWVGVMLGRVAVETTLGLLVSGNSTSLGNATSNL